MADTLIIDLNIELLDERDQDGNLLAWLGEAGFRMLEGGKLWQCEEVSLRALNADEYTIVRKDAHGF